MVLMGTCLVVDANGAPIEALGNCTPSTDCVIAMGASEGTKRFILEKVNIKLIMTPFGAE